MLLCKISRSKTSFLVKYRILMLCFYVKYCVLRYQVIQAIQVSYDISAENTYKREKKGLLLAARQTKCENLLLLTDHESGEIEEDGHKMKIQPVYEWSLELGV